MLFLPLWAVRIPGSDSRFGSQAVPTFSLPPDTLADVNPKEKPRQTAANIDPNGPEVGPEALLACLACCFCFGSASSVAELETMGAVARRAEGS